jgi:hypothetical protein
MTDNKNEFGLVDGVGYAFAVLLPFIGFFLGLALIAANRKHGVFVFLVSIAMFIFYIASVASS